MHGSWSTRLQPYYPFWEYVGSSDFAYCPIDGVAQKWPEGGALTGQSADSASYCVVNGSIADEIYDYRLATHTIATLQLAKRVRPANFLFVIYAENIPLFLGGPAFLRHGWVPAPSQRLSRPPAVLGHVSGCI